MEATALGHIRQKRQSLQSTRDIHKHMDSLKRRIQKIKEMKRPEQTFEAALKEDIDNDAFHRPRFQTKRALSSI